MTGAPPLMDGNINNLLVTAASNDSLSSHLLNLAENLNSTLKNITSDDYVPSHVLRSTIHQSLVIDDPVRMSHETFRSTFSSNGNTTSHLTYEPLDDFRLSDDFHNLYLLALPVIIVWIICKIWQKFKTPRYALYFESEK